MNIQKNIANFIFELNIILLLLSLSACSNAVPKRNTGTLLDDYVVSSIKQELEDRENYLLAQEGDVFWSESGTLWHITHRCTYLADSKTILHGSIEDAKLDGKKKECERCTQNNLFDEFLSDEVEKDDLFFTKEGKLLHIYRDCSYISDSDKVMHANLEEAKSVGKTELCGRCQKQKIYLEIENREYSAGDVFFSEGSSSYHKNRYCSYLSGAEKVYCASVEIANELGKEKPCSKCGK